MTAAVAVGLLGLGVVTLWGTLETTRATQAQSHALALDAALSDAKDAVGLQEMSTRQYRLQPSVAGWIRYVDSAAAVDDALQRAAEISSGREAGDGSRLREEEAVYRRASDRLITLIASQNPDAARQDLVEVTPAFYTLHRDIDAVSRNYDSDAQRLVADLHSFQTRIFIATALGFALGFGLVGMIWRVMLGYQRRIIEHAEASEHQALHDPLTGLANRLLFQRRLDAALLAASRASGGGPVVMLIDLNGFKRVNDTLGHQAGDELLIEIGHRLREVGREGDTIARLGGDEFAVLLPASPSDDVVNEIADRVCGALRRDHHLAAGSAAVSGSVGIVMATPGMGAEEILHHADAAMYRAKTITGGVAVYDAEIGADQGHRTVLQQSTDALRAG